VLKGVGYAALPDVRPVPQEDPGQLVEKMVV